MPVAQVKYDSPAQQQNVHYMTELLAHNKPYVILGKYGKRITLPRNKSEQIAMDRPVPLTFDATAATESASPTALGMTYVNINGTILRYDDLRRVSAEKFHLSQQNSVRDSAMLQTEKIQNVNELLCWNENIAGTNALYNSSAHSARTDVDGAVTAGAVRRVTRTLDSNKAQYLSQINKAGPGQGTVPSEAAFYAFGHTDLLSDLRDCAGWISYAEYGTGKREEYERGQIGDVKFILSPQFVPFDDAGALTGSTGMLSSGTKVDVYPLVFVGRDAYASVILSGFKDVVPNILDKPDKADPTNAWVDIAVAWYYLAKRLNEDWIVRLECGVTANP